MSQSRIVRSAGATTFEGPDAIALVQAITLRGAIQLYLRTGLIPTRGVTITKMLALATSITKKPYRRGQGEQAIADLKAWSDALRCALPVEFE